MATAFRAIRMLDSTCLRAVALAIPFNRVLIHFTGTFWTRTCLVTHFEALLSYRYRLLMLQDHVERMDDAGNKTQQGQ